MGWLFYTDRRVQTYADEKAEIARLCTSHGDTRKTELVKACKVGSTWYAAARITSLDGTPVEDATYVTDADGSITFGAGSMPKPAVCRASPNWARLWPICSADRMALACSLRMAMSTWSPTWSKMRSEAQP